METVLVAGSDRPVVDLLRGYLSKTFCRTLLAANLLDTLDSSAREKPDLILTTFIDPGIGDATAPTPLILLSDAGHADLEMLRVSAVLSRSVGEERFLSEARKFVELPALREPRVATDLSCLARIDRRDVPVRVIDLSSGGALLRSVFELPAQGAGFSLALEIPIEERRERFECQVVVIRSVMDTLVGVRFLDLQPEARQGISRYLDEVREEAFDF